MGRHHKRFRPIPSNLEERQLQILQEVSKECINELQYRLKIHMINSNLSKDLVDDIHSSLNLNNSLSTDIESNSNVDNETIIEGVPVRSSSRIIRELAVDQHNEICEVCEKPGDLLCCDSCSLVFHLSCLRPKITHIPKGTWNCPFCIANETVAGDIIMAKSSIILMNRLSRGIDDNSHFMLDNVCIQQNSRNFTVRMYLGSTEEEMGRFNTVDEALSFISKKSSLQDSKPEELTLRNSKDKTNEVNSVNENTIGSLQEKKLWCNFCLDDDKIRICAFCGCKACFGKYDSNYLILCDGCDLEMHTYCLKPALSHIPAGTWYCQNCQEKQDINIEKSYTEDNENAPIENSGDEDNDQHRKNKGGRGRPRGSLRSRTESFEVSQSENNNNCNHSEQKNDLSANLETLKILTEKMSSELLNTNERNVFKYMTTWSSKDDIVQIRDLLLKQREKLKALIEQEIPLDENNISTSESIPVLINE